MRKLYWRPRAVSKTALILIALLSAGGLMLVENVRVTKKRPHYEDKRRAAQRMFDGMEVIREARVSMGVDIDPDKDPTGSGLVGLPISPITSVSGVLEAKQTSVNPNYAAVVVDMLKTAGVKEGDTVAVGVSGSFPAINLATYCALETLKLKPVIISSAAASRWGANIPELTWLDMEKRLFDAGIISFRSVYCTVGGDGDSGLGMSEEGKKLIDEAIARSGIPSLDPIEPVLEGDEDAEFVASIDQRIGIYNRQAGSSTIACYVNVGGGMVSTGKRFGKQLFEAGLNQRAPLNLAKADGVMARFIRQRIPVIHLVQIADLAERYGMEVAPTTLPRIGESAVFQTTGYSVLLCVGLLVAILGSLYGFIRSDIGFRILHGGVAKKESGHPEPMV